MAAFQRTHLVDRPQAGPSVHHCEAGAVFCLQIQRETESLSPNDSAGRGLFVTTAARDCSGKAHFEARTGKRRTARAGRQSGSLVEHLYLVQEPDRANKSESKRRPESRP